MKVKAEYFSEYMHWYVTEIDMKPSLEEERVFQRPTAMAITFCSVFCSLQTCGGLIHCAHAMFFIVKVAQWLYILWFVGVKTGWLSFFVKASSCKKGQYLLSPKQKTPFRQAVVTEHLRQQVLC